MNGHHQRDNGKARFSKLRLVIIESLEIVLLLVTAYKLVEAALKH